jgi:predicted dehydrogenase
MLRVGVIGLGFMGRNHVSCYRRLESEGFPVQLAAVCDIDPERRKGHDIVNGNIGSGDRIDYSNCAIYADYQEMISRESLDYIDIALPTYLHAGAAVAALKADLHVLCEKPMARTETECTLMIDTALKSGKYLMVAQCLRFWPAYEYLKYCVETSCFGQPVSAYFFRGGGTPKWSWNNWLLDGKLSGGCLLDQHVHDVDIVQWLFGMARAVSCTGISVIPGSGYDALSTKYLYPDGKVVCAEDDWTINGGFNFDMLYRVNFEHGSVHFSHSQVKVYPADGEGFEPDLPKDDGYYREIVYFIDCITKNIRPERCLPESTRDTIRLALAEQQSADNSGAWVEIGR